MPLAPPRAMLSRKPRGLTLIEMVVVITILSLLMAAVGVYAVGVLVGAKHDVAQQDLRTALISVEMFKARRNRYPSTDEGFAAMVEAKVLKKLPKDPWGGALGYALEAGEPVVTSLGADQLPGGTGDNADLSSRDLED